MNFYIIYPSELGPYMQKDKIVLVDIRNRQEYMKSHWPGAINMEEKEIKNIESFLRKMPQKLVAVFYFVFIETAPPSRGGFAMGCFSKAAAKVSTCSC